MIEERNCARAVSLSYAPVERARRRFEAALAPATLKRFTATLFAYGAIATGIMAAILALHVIILEPVVLAVPSL